MNGIYVREMSLAELEKIKTKDLMNLSSKEAAYMADKIRMVCQMLRYYKDMRN